MTVNWIIYICASGIWFSLLVLIGMRLALTERFFLLIKQLNSSAPVLKKEGVNETIFFVMGGISLFIFLFERLVTYSQKGVSSDPYIIYTYSAFLPLVQMVIFLSLIFTMLKTGQKLAYGLAGNNFSDKISLAIIIIVVIFAVVLTVA